MLRFADNNNHKTKGVLFLAVLSVAVSFNLFFPRSANAIVPVHCPTICRTWDIALSGPIGASPERWFATKERGPSSITGLIGDILNGNFSFSSLAQIADWDAVAWFLARTVLEKFTEGIILWIQTGQDPFFSGGTEGTLFVTDIDEFLLDAADNAASTFLTDYFGPAWNDLCTPFRLSVGISLSQSYGRDYGSFGPKAQCSITDIVENLEDFYADFENGGWEAWIATSRYENTLFGSLTLGREESRERETRAVQANVNDFRAGGGFPGLRKCVKAVHINGSIVNNPDMNSPDGKAGNLKCLPDGYLTQSPGKAIEDQLADAFGQEIHKLEAADEIDEIIQQLFSALLGWLIGGGSGGGGLLGTDLKGNTTPPVGCNALTGRPSGCMCTNNTQCASNQCTSGICSSPAATPQCSDGRDNDSDGLIDLADPGCTGPTDTSEANTPIPAPPTECSDGKDNDNDALIDYPADPGCTSSTDDMELDFPTF